MTTEIQDRNRQFKELMMTKNKNKNKKPFPVTFFIETQDEQGEWRHRMDSSSPDYLDSVGRRWVDGKFCADFRVSAKEG